MNIIYLEFKKTILNLSANQNKTNKKQIKKKQIKN